MTGGTPARVHTCHFDLGDLKCVVLSDGNVSSPPGNVFANEPAAQVEGALAQRGLPVDVVKTLCPVLYVEAGTHRLLVDLGAGTFWPGAGKLTQNLGAAGIDPADIDTVLLTHAHPGHVGGALDSRGTPVYPNARYTLSKDEWEFWTSEVAFAKASERHIVAARKHLEPIRDRMQLVDGEREIVPGIRLIPAPGHTPGHMAVSLSAGGVSLLHIADTVFHPLHLEHPGWTSIYDVDPKQAAATKHRVLDRAARSQALVIGHHLLPFPGLGYVSRSGYGWRWQPIQDSFDRRSTP
jgi:glyoxylase-like metal-dependent hydrolase (beta-lactamase superfamily II)